MVQEPRGKDMIRRWTVFAGRKTIISNNVLQNLVRAAVPQSERGASGDESLARPASGRGLRRATLRATGAVLSIAPPRCSGARFQLGARSSAATRAFSEESEGRAADAPRSDSCSRRALTTCGKMASTIERKTLEASEEPVDEVLQMPPSLLTCGGCQQSIGDRFFLKAIEQYWHEDCLSCDLCGCRLGEVGRRLYYKLGRKLCRRDYLRLFGQDGLCASCEKRIRAFEMTMRVRDKVYHLECFKCAACQKHFCVGDRYLLINSDIVCEQDIFEWTKLNGNLV
ncbi:hypothetical protein SRHO_G00088050 [Serrasalmus rhombeus]